MIKEIKLRDVNKIKYCVRCKDFVLIKMLGYVGLCCNCGEVLYNMDTRINRNGNK